MTAIPVPLSPAWPDEPGFNTAAANAVYKAMASMDEDEALVFGRILVADTVRHELITKRREFTAALDEQVEARAEVARAHLARTAVAKARRGQDNTADLAMFVELGKAFDFSDDQRAEYARRQRRDLATGRFAESHVKMGYDSDVKPLQRDHAKQFDIPDAPAGMGAKDRARFQQAYLQLRDLIGPYTGMSKGDALLHLHVRDSKGGETTRIATLPGRGEKLDLHRHLHQGEHVHSASVSVVPTPGAGGAIYDALNYVGAPRAGATLAGATAGGALDPDGLASYREGLESSYAQDDYIPSQRVFRNLESGSRLLTSSLGDAAPRKLKFALGVGEHVGRLGPEAQKVIGPTADRTAYRYRGTERNPAPALRHAMASIRRNPSLPVEDKREHLLHGTETDSGWQPSGVLSYFRAQLPTVDLNTLQLKSGTVPPSRGIILDAKGQVAHESVGFGDDWYLPFNLKNLKALKGGEYIRTRTWGGPTTEDIYTGLVSGARAMTVVSHNGTYTIDFNDTLRGGRRFNDKAAQMVGRYGHLLDAVRSEQVQLGGIHPSRMAEIRDDVARQYDEDEEPAEFGKELARRIGREKKNPTLSQAQRAEATLGFFNDLASGQGDGTGQVINPDQLVASFAGQAANKKFAAAAAQARAGQYLDRFRDDPNMSQDAFRAREIGQLQDDDPVKAGEKVAAALGVKPQLDRAIKTAEAENKKNLSSLQLNGEGYKVALDALQEQFPYYIDRVEFHPWSDARQQRDTGYVRPNRNRAAEALAGYFDPLSSKTGESKVYADSTRGQNRSHPDAGKLRRYQTAAREPDATTAGGGTAAPAKELTPEAAAMLRDDADQALFDALRAQVNFGPDIKAVPNILANPAAIANAPVGQFINDPQPKQIAPNVVRMHLMTPAAWQAEKDAGRAHQLAMGAARELRANPLFDVGQDVLANVENEGAPRPKTKLGAHASDHLDKLDDEFDKLGPSFDAANEPNADRVKAAYQGHGAIGELVAAGKLPDDVGATDFDAKADALRDELKQARAAITAKVRRGGNVTSSEWRRVDRPAEGLIAARQLRRRHDEHVSRELAANVMPAAAAPEQGAVTHREDKVVMPPIPPNVSPQEYAAYIAEVQRVLSQERKEME